MENLKMLWMFWGESGIIRIDQDSTGPRKKAPREVAAPGALFCVSPLLTRYPPYATIYLSQMIQSGGVPYAPYPAPAGTFVPVFSL